MNKLRVKILLQGMKRKRNFAKKILYSSAGTLVFLLLALFFFQKNTLVEARAKFEDCTRRFDELTSQNENLEIGFVEKNHLKNIENIAQQLNFEKVEKIHYIRVLEGTVVSR